MSHRKIVVIVFMFGALLCSLCSFQDGSDTKYLNWENLNDSLVGQICHVDFGNNSFGGLIVDTLKLEISGTEMTFIEHRADTGFNNWFAEHYLLRLSEDELPIARINYFTIDSIREKAIYVTGHISYGEETMPIDSITVFQCSFDKNNVAKILIKG